MDGVLVDLMNGWLAMYNERSGENVKKEDIIAFDAGSFVEDKENFYDIMREPHFFGPERKAQPGAIEGFRELCETDHDVHIVTSPHAKSLYSERDKKAWVLHHLPFFDPKKITMTHFKHLYVCDVLLDDRPSTLEKIKKTGRTGVCMDQPWNQKYEGKRVHTWKEFLQLISTLEEV